MQRVFCYFHGVNTKTIDIVNIGLMLVSCIAAYLLPFELFLFSYAVLGPLHYLTEISWLHRRDYFTSGKFDYIIFIPIGVLLTFFALFGGTDEQAGRWSTNLIFICFVSALGMVLLRGWLYKLLLLCAAFLLGYLISGVKGVQLFFGMYLPTLIHVFIFTGLFILQGALKNKSITGILSVVVFVGCGFSFFFYQPVLAWYHVSAYDIDNIRRIKFDGLIASIINLLHIDKVTYQNFYQIVFHAIPGQSVMRFIAFAYTYHYLNWFSKTSVIKWHLVPRRWLIAVLVLWLSSVALYAYDYFLGLELLFLLSMLHVFLEFPLNYRSMIGIAEELGLPTGFAKVAAPAPVVATVGKTKKKK